MRVAICLAIAASLCAATPAWSADNQNCMQALRAGKPYPGIGRDALNAIDVESRAMADSTATIARLRDERDHLETLEIFFQADSRNIKTIESMRARLDFQIKTEYEDYNWYEEILSTTVSVVCDELEQHAPPPQSKNPPPGGYGTSAVLEMAGQPVSAAPYMPWTTVAPGQIEQHTAGYSGTYTWSTIPYHIGPEGFDLTLTAVAQCANGQNLSTGINLRGGFDFVKSASDDTNVSTDVSAYCANNSDTKSLTVHVKPSKTYGVGQDVVIQIGAFYGPGVTYHFKPVRTGN